MRPRPPPSSLPAGPPEKNPAAAPPSPALSIRTPPPSSSTGDGVRPHIAFRSLALLPHLLRNHLPLACATQSCLTPTYLLYSCSQFASSSITFRRCSHSLGKCPDPGYVTIRTVFPRAFRIWKNSSPWNVGTRTSASPCRISSGVVTL